VLINVSTRLIGRGGALAQAAQADIANYRTLEAIGRFFTSAIID